MQKKPTVVLRTYDGIVYDLIKRLLESEGYAVIPQMTTFLAEDIRKMISDEDDIVLIIADYVLPEMTGAAFAGTLRSVLRNPDLPYLLLSDGAHIGGEHLLVKPFTPHEFLAMVHLRLRTPIKRGIVAHA